MAEIEECPTDKSNEKEIIKTLLDCEEKKIGEIWFVISLNGTPIIAENCCGNNQ